MTMTEPAAPSTVPTRTRTMRVPRSRGALSGLLLIVLGAWGALIPFIGPYLNYSYGTDQAWHWTEARGWLEVLPGAVAAFGGLLLMLSANRIRGSVGGWLAAVAGAWFVVGRELATILHLHLGSVGHPVSLSPVGQAAANLGYFDGLGVVIVFLAAFALGRLAVVGVRDVRVAERIEQRAAEQARAEELARRREAERHTAAAAAAGATAGAVAEHEHTKHERERERVEGQPADAVRTESVAGRNTAGYERDRPYGAEDPAAEATVRQEPVGADYGPQYGAESRQPGAHEAPPEERR